MARIYAQKFPVISASAAATLGISGSFSGSALCAGYSRAVGMLYASEASKAASGLIIHQSSDFGENWDIVSASDALAGSGTLSESVEIVGNAIRVTYRNGATAASLIRFLWQLRPI